MRSRRTKEQLLHDRSIAWANLLDSWRMWTSCARCDEMAVCRGKSRDAMKCKTCFMQGR